MTDNITVNPVTSTVSVSNSTNAVTISQTTPNITVANTTQSVSVTNQQTNVTVASSGVQGPTGSGAGFFTYVQNTPSSVWTITHGLGGNPAVTVLDTSGNQCEGSIGYTDANTMTITFSAPFSGTAYLV